MSLTSVFCCCSSVARGVSWVRGKGGERRSARSARGTVSVRSRPLAAVVGGGSTFFRRRIKCLYCERGLSAGVGGSMSAAVVWTLSGVDNEDAVLAELDVAARPLSTAVPATSPSTLLIVIFVPDGQDETVRCEEVS